jgi:hypothetical protein
MLALGVAIVAFLPATIARPLMQDLSPEALYGRGLARLAPANNDFEGAADFFRQAAERELPKAQLRFENRQRWRKSQSQFHRLCRHAGAPRLSFPGLDRCGIVTVEASMQSFILSLMLLLQGIPIQPSQGGIIAGVLSDAAGQPVPGVRITAVAVPQSLLDPANGSMMGALTESDETGHYLLQDIPPGRYYISAGRLDLPTYFPGTQKMPEAQIITVAAGSIAEGIDFRFYESSAGRVPGNGLPSSFVVPVDVTVTGGAGIPLSGPEGIPSIRFEAGGGMTTVPLASPVLRIDRPRPVEYRVTIENLPEGFTLEEMRYGGVDLKSEPLRLTYAVLGTNPVQATGALPALQVVQGFNTWIRKYVFTGGIRATLPTVVVAPNTTIVGNHQALSIKLKRLPQGTPTGVQVTGSLPSGAAHFVFLSGKQGLFFSDGHFEFQNVSPGRHTIVTLGSNPSAALLVVGKENVDGVRLESTPVIPLGYDIPLPSDPAETRPPGSAIPLVVFRGNVADRETGRAVSNGTAYLTGDKNGGISYDSLDENGRFEFPPLLAGSYNVEIWSPDYETVTRKVVVPEKGLNLPVEVVRTQK